MQRGFMHAGNYSLSLHTSTNPLCDLGITIDMGTMSLSVQYVHGMHVICVRNSRWFVCITVTYYSWQGLGESDIVIEVLGELMNNSVSLLFRTRYQSTLICALLRHSHRAGSAMHSSLARTEIDCWFGGNIYFKANLRRSWEWLRHRSMLRKEVTLVPMVRARWVAFQSLVWSTPLPHSIRP